MTDATTGLAGIVFNPAKIARDALEPFVTTFEAEAGYSPTRWYETDRDDAGLSAARTAIDDGCTVIAAAGGDGTVRTVADALRRHDVTFAVIPEGTGNLYARNLGLKLNPEDSVRTLFLGEDHPADLGVVELTLADGTVNEDGFLVMAGLGIDAKMIAKTSSKLKRRVGWLAYIDGGMRALPDVKSIRMRYSLDDGPRRTMNAHSLLVGNCGQLPGGILLMPDAELDDGILDIAALRPRGPFGWLKIWQKVAWENGVLRKSVAGRKIIDLTSKDVRSVTYLRGQRIAVEFTGEHEVQLDGDVIGTATSLIAYADHHALRVRMPSP